MILSNFRLCIEDGTWSQEAPACREITCNEPDIHENLIIEPGTRLVGSLAKYSCPKGHYIIGNNTRVCMNSGQWTGRTPKCKGNKSNVSMIVLSNFLIVSAVDCGRPNEIENGRVIVVNDTTLYGGSAEYHCIPKYQRIGQFLRKCMEDGKWSGDEPRCESKNIQIHHKIFLMTYLYFNFSCSK